MVLFVMKSVIRKPDISSVCFCSICPAVSRTWASLYIPICSLFISQEVETCEIWKLVE